MMYGTANVLQMLISHVEAISKLNKEKIFKLFYFK